jgi:chlorobactene glucosyltransferase
MIIAGYILFAMLVLRFLVVLVNYLSKPYLPEAAISKQYPAVSVLIPARNEAENLPALLSDLKQLNYPNFEVIVCNDHSDDDTEEVLKSAKAGFPQLSYFNNEILPDGWIGKNFACHQLAQKAKGEYLIFIDADVRLQPAMLSKAVAYAQKKRLKLLSVFPEQLIKTPGEWKTVPLMNQILLSYLPLCLVRWRWFSSLSAANGQFMMFDTDNYRHNQWHLKMKSRNVEDILIARQMKRQKMSISVKLGRNDISCRMYAGYEQAVRGFSLNIHQYFNGHRAWMLFYWLLVWLRLPYFALNGQYGLLLLSVLLFFFMEIMIARLSRFSIAKMFRYRFERLFALNSIVWLNMENRFSHKIEWKGRVYEI